MDSGYPMLRLLAPVGCGLRAGTILLAGRNFAAAFVAAQIAAARAARPHRSRGPEAPVRQRLPDGSRQSRG